MSSKINFKDAGKNDVDIDIEGFKEGIERVDIKLLPNQLPKISIELTAFDLHASFPETEVEIYIGQYRFTKQAYLEKVLPCLEENCDCIDGSKIPIVRGRILSDEQK